MNTLLAITPNPENGSNDVQLQTSVGTKWELIIAFTKFKCEHVLSGQVSTLIAF